MTDFIDVHHGYRDEANQRWAFDYLLLDGAQHPDLIEPYLQTGDELCWCPVLETGLAEQLGGAGLFLLALDDDTPSAQALLELLDEMAPCAVRLKSPLEIEALATHLRAYLFAENEQGERVMMRYFDPRLLVPVLSVWERKWVDLFLQPLAQMQFRGHQAEWQTLRGFNSQETRFALPGPLVLDAERAARLAALGEADALLDELVDTGVVASSETYLARYQDFLPRLQRARSWGLSRREDLLHFCTYSYQHGAAFDEQADIAALLQQLQRSQGHIAGFHLLVAEVLRQRPMQQQTPPTVLPTVAPELSARPLAG
ncbi:protein of unknown function [Andreprevotia lacus DSM 23236]|jgi:hypothetical protein|uniref:DUF4123 domain-containing protein n=1 Tax=Andreprevotia lacus DSM 23236 TaxID=1121001 RepID=A0A1W1Y185_9NEIS|nr:DUF4123 domain-containing protein [Andreprevotia lacus]SMC29949.1 protein of unknown function [Andreprevotia lacus DSM 23236]